MVKLTFTSLLDTFITSIYKSAGLHSHTILLDSETSIHCWLSPSLLSKASEKPRKPALLLIHGFGPKPSWQWRHQVRPLAAHFSLIVPDLLFFGNSTTLSPHRSEAFQAATLARLLDKLVIGRVVAAVGTSYGGFVAYHLARLVGRERVEKVVIASSDLLKGGEDDKMFTERAGVGSVKDVMLPKSTGDLRKLMGLAVYRPPRYLPEFLLRDVLKNLFQDNLEQKVELLKGVSLGNKEEFQLTPLAQEVLIIWGEHDKIFPLNKAFELKKRLGEKAKLEVMKKTGHIPQMEHAERFNEVLLKFLLGSPRSSL